MDRVTFSAAGGIEISQQVAIPHVVARGAAVILGTRLIVVGGGSTEAVYAADLTPDGSIGSWSPLEGTYRETDLAAVVSDGHVYLAGGDARPRNITAVVFDAMGKPTIQPTMADVLPRPTAAAAAVAVGGFVYVVGGNGASARDVIHGTLGLAMRASDLASGPDLPVGRSGHVLLAL